MKAKLTQLSSLFLALAMSHAVQAETFSFNNDVNEQSDALVVFKSSEDTTGFSAFDQKTQGQLSRAIKANQFDASYNTFVEILAPTNLNYDRVLIVGLGDKTLTKAQLTKLGGNIAGQLTSNNINEISVSAEHFNAEQASFIAHGINLRAYSYDKYKKEKRQEKSYTFDVTDSQATQSAYSELEALQSGIFLARDLTNEIPTNLTPADFAKEAKKLKTLGVKVKVLEPKELKKLGMNALEAVGRGSKDGSRLVVAHYQGSDDAPIAIAGKGITFDSGGIQIKTSEHIVRMKSDMAGAAAALGTVKALAQMKANVNVVAVMGMAANMVSENSYIPGDVVTTAEGITVEITHTDAEGRLVLSDAMWYARKYYQPSVLLDIATLTGGKYRALGNKYAGIFSESDQLVEAFKVAGDAVNEPVWHLPLGYKEMLASPIADIRNTGKGGPSATTAASFLQHFAGDTPWLHIDMAGNGLAASASGEHPVGGTGYGVSLMTEWILNHHTAK
ncbi:leucyl aminopeptidase [Thalassotalea sp. LPB0316]|uniref:leucyl aminopeptidase family protein n=1 Tax=Thalassotalea sp. LPB0316 TaxID=2769490 RepID=UPI0018691ADF|nr:leucyl aminopeptidase [Thalassotalea sp. LPB0316]QOL26806.1 leucyl aminopeptidase [Thalassotalea sp. LPB0316]